MFGLRRLRTVVRVLAVLTGVYLVAWWTWLLAALPLLPLRVALEEHSAQSLSAVSFGDALAGCCALALVGSAAWLVLTVTAVVVQTVLPASRGLRVVSHLCPATVRRAVLAACGLALAAGLATPAAADAPRAPLPGSPVQIAGLQVPDRAAAVDTSGAPDAPQTVAAVTVRPGDCLWSLAARALPRDADDARIAQAWRAIYAANRTRIGADPDLIIPGTTLLLHDHVTSEGKEPR